ncbi:MAG: peptidase C39 family protein [Dongiaceae bacterium]
MARLKARPARKGAPGENAGKTASKAHNGTHFKSVGRRGSVPYYNQTTDFTCGPSSLLMAMKALDSQIDVSRAHELQLWREATTIFMGGPHHGGCGVTGLALAAHRRGFDVEVWINHKGTFLGSLARDKGRAKVMTELHKADLAEMKRLKIPYRIGARSIDDLRKDIASGAIPVVLVSMEYIHKDPTAHWVVVTGIDDKNVTVNDPWISKSMGHTPRKVTDYVVPRTAFPAMTAYGVRKERATVLLRRR